jgi:hypothetical protein
MGCFFSVPDQDRLDSISKTLSSRLIESIEAEDEQKLSKIQVLFQKLHSKSSNIFEEKAIHFKSFRLSPLSYSVVKGKPRAFKFLISQGCSFQKMTEDFSEFQIKPLDLVLAKGYVTLFHVFFEEYLKSRPPEKSLKNPSSSVQIATRKGMLDILTTIHYQYSTKCFFEEFNFAAKDENGENCALIACREGILPLIQFFHQVRPSDFLEKNRFGQGAILICLIGFHEKNNYGFKECVKFLVEKAKLDYTLQAKEIFDVAQGELLEYFEEKFRNIGILVDRKEQLGYCKAENCENEVFQMLCGEDNPSLVGTYVMNSLRNRN